MTHLECDRAGKAPDVQTHTLANRVNVGDTPLMLDYQAEQEKPYIAVHLIETGCEL